MSVKKSEVHNSLWKSCDELRGGMDASQYKDYILVLLFVKYVSDRYAGKPNALIEIPKGGSFADMVALKGKPEIGDGINKIIAKLAEHNDLKGVIDVADFNDSNKLGKGKEMQDRLSNLIAIFQKPALDFSKNQTDVDDLIADASEYIMHHFATESGRSKGQFYTPAEVSRIMVKVIGVSKAKRQDQTVYDPNCGSGSMLLKAADETEHGITIYGQEMDVVTRGLAKMNMILHNNPAADIQQGNTLAKPMFINVDGTLKTFDFAVANPPFSFKMWSYCFDPEHDELGRFESFGVPPANNGDYAFLLHLVKSLNSIGKGAIILPNGVLFRGNSEAEIRKKLVLSHYIKGIISLPTNLFYGTDIPACIIVIDKENAQSRKGIFMVDASRGYKRVGGRNYLREQDIHKIVSTFNNQIDVPEFSRFVSFTEISNQKNNYNLNIPRYIEYQEVEDSQDIEARMLGGIPGKDVDNLAFYWTACPTLKNALFSPNVRPGYYTLKVEKERIKSTILENNQYYQYTQKANEIFINWKTQIIPMLYDLQIGSKSKELITTLSEKFLAAFENKSLIDKYEVYQKLMDYWTEEMQDDVYLISTNGWKAEITAIKNARGKETGWNCDLIPKQIVIAKYFAKEQETINNLNAEADLDKKILNKYKNLTEVEIKALIIEDKWLKTIQNAVTAEVERIFQKLANRLNELAERYEKPLLPILKATVDKFSKKAEYYLSNTINERVPIDRIKEINEGKTSNKSVRVALAQINFQLIESSEDKSFVIKLLEPDVVRQKIFKALELAKEENANIIVFPELSTMSTWVKEISDRYPNMIIIFGSYYENSHNKCPVIMNGHVFYVEKIKPSPYHELLPSGDGMKSGSERIVFQTPYGRFMIFICQDFIEDASAVIHELYEREQGIDIAIVLSYNDAIGKFQSKGNEICQEFNYPYVLIANAENFNKKKAGGSCIIKEENNKVISERFSKRQKARLDDKIQFKLLEAMGEEVIVATLDLENKSVGVHAKNYKVSMYKKIPLTSKV